MRRRTPPSAIETIAGDALFAFCAGIVVALKQPLDDEGNVLLKHFIINTLMTALHAVFQGKYNNNPISMWSRYADGTDSSGLLLMTLRSVAQVAGAVGGAAAVEQPEPKNEIRNKRPPESVERKALLTVAITLFTSLIESSIDAAIHGAYHKAMAYLTYGVLKGIFLQGIVGAKTYMNPAKELGSALVQHRRLDGEHFLLCWVCPFIGAMTAIWIFPILKKITRFLVFILYITTRFRTK